MLQPKLKNEEKETSVDIGSDVVSEFLENPGSLFWLLDGLYHGVTSVVKHVQVSTSYWRKNKSF